MYICIHIYIYIYKYIYTYIYVYIHIHKFVYMYTHMYTYMYAYIVYIRETWLNYMQNMTHWYVLISETTTYDDNVWDMTQSYVVRDALTCTDIWNNDIWWYVRHVWAATQYAQFVFLLFFLIFFCSTHQKKSDMFEPQRNMRKYPCHMYYIYATSIDEIRTTFCIGGNIYDLF